MGNANRMRNVLNRTVLTTILCVVLLITVTGSCGALKAVWGQVYKSDHNAASGYGGTWAAIVVNHNGTNTTYDDPDGIDSSGYYSISLPEGDNGTKWAQNDTFRVIVDGTPWGDENWTAHNATGGGSGHSYTDTNFTIDRNITQQQDVETLTDVEIPEFSIGPVVLAAALVVAASIGFRRRRRC